MASFQARGRDPLLDQGTQAALERRGRELLGLGLIGAGLAVAAMLATYSPDDPSWLAATEAEAGNALGRIGAAIASPLFVIAGHAAWLIALLLAGWGLRFVLHRGSDRALARAVFAPIAVALAAVQASTLVPGAEWDHSFGLGGLFGDTVLGALLGVLPVSAGLGLKVLSFLSFFATLAMGAFVLGFDRAELRALWHFLWRGAVLAYVLLLTLVLRGGSAAAAHLAAAAAARRARRADPALDARDEPAPRPAGVLRADPRPARRAAETPAPGLLARVPALLRRVIDPSAKPSPLMPGAVPKLADVPSAALPM
jgi:S-DNA-T family DNA segregation ATPase FtsK/SpoIIIE